MEEGPTTEGPREGLSKVQDVAAPAGTVTDSANGVEPELLLTWLIILVVSALLLWWQSASYKREQERKLQIAQTEAKYQAEQQEARKARIEELRKERLKREAEAREELERRKQQKACQQQTKKDVFSASQRAKVEKIQGALDEELSLEADRKQLEQEEKQQRRAAALQAKQARETSRQEEHALSKAIKQAEYSSSSATTAQQVVAQKCTSSASRGMPLFSERDASARLQAVERAQEHLEKAVEGREATERARRQQVVAAAHCKAQRVDNAVINGVVPTTETEADRAVREGTIEFSEERELKALQDEEYRQALEIDRARTAAIEQAKLAKEELIQKWEAMKEPAPGAPNCVDVLVRLPTGQRLRRRFENTTLLADIFEFVDVSWQPAKGTKAADFQLSTDFPKRMYGREEVVSSGTTLGDEQFGNQQLFMLQQL